MEIFSFYVFMSMTRRIVSHQKQSLILFQNLIYHFFIEIENALKHLSILDIRGKLSGI
jgi:hypothetical protein